jgi:hypothetical protein
VLVRLSLAAAALAAVAPALPAVAQPDPPRPVCQLRFEDDPMFVTSPDFPVYVEGPGRPYWVC